MVSLPSKVAKQPKNTSNHKTFDQLSLVHSRCLVIICSPYQVELGPAGPPKDQAGRRPATHAIHPAQPPSRRPVRSLNQGTRHEGRWMALAFWMLRVNRIQAARIRMRNYQNGGTQFGWQKKGNQKETICFADSVGAPTSPKSCPNGFIASTAPSHHHFFFVCSRLVRLEAS